MIENSCYCVASYWALPVTGRCHGLAALAPCQAMTQKEARGRGPRTGTWPCLFLGHRLAWRRRRRQAIATPSNWQRHDIRFQRQGAMGWSGVVWGGVGNAKAESPRPYCIVYWNQLCIFFDHSPSIWYSLLGTFHLFSFPDPLHIVYYAWYLVAGLLGIYWCAKHCRRPPLTANRTADSSILPYIPWHFAIRGPPPRP